MSTNSNSSHFVAWMATLGTFILMMQVGLKIGWISPNIARLMSKDSDIPIDANQASWLISISQLFGAWGAFLSLPSTIFLGSRATVIMAFTFFSVSWMCMIVANSIIWLFIGRALVGITFSLTFSCFSLYLGEVAQPHLRGRLISIAAGGIRLGIVFGTIAETYLPRKISSSIYLTFCLFSLMLLLWLRDSPYFLVKTGDIQGAKESIAFYHGKTGDEKKLQEIQDFVKAHANTSFKDKIRDLNSSINRKSLLIIVTLFAMPQISGTLIVLSYMQIILDNAKCHVIPSAQFVIYANIISVLCTLLTCSLIDKLGRRSLMIVSSLGTCIAMTGLGIHFFLLDQGVDPDNLQWLPIICILSYLIMYSVGFSSIPSTVLSELFTDNVKSSAAVVSTISAALFSFLVSKSYQYMVDSIGEYYVFWIYAFFSFLATPYSLFILPETKGKTFQEIQNMLQSKN